MTLHAQIVSINVGRPQTVPFQHTEISTSFTKQPVTAPLFLSQLNFHGDEQADLVNHGGPDKAICVYPFEHYSHWEQVLSKPLGIPAFGENITSRGLLETEVCIGDIFAMGEAVVQVSQPRQPCFKIGLKHGRPDLTLMVQQTGYTGFYFRVLEEGVVSPDNELRVLQKHPLQVSIAFANFIRYEDKQNEAGIRRILDVDALSASWRDKFQSRLQDLKKESAK